jgi:hypothetical protein
MTALVHRADPPEADDLVARSIALLEAVGFQLIPLAKPIAGAWDLLAVSPRGLTLIAAVRERPSLLGATYGPLPGWPAGTVRVVHVWSDGALPKAITL